MLRLGEKVKEDAGIELLLSQLAAFQKMLPRGVEGAMEGGEEKKGLRGEQRLRFGSDRAEDFDAGDRRHCAH